MYNTLSYMYVHLLVLSELFGISGPTSHSPSRSADPSSVSHTIPKSLIIGSRVIVMLLRMDLILWKILLVHASAVVLHCHYWHLSLPGCYSLLLLESKNVSCEVNFSNGLSAAEAQA